MAEVWRVLKSTGVFLCFSSPKHIRNMLNICQDTGFTYQDIIVWDKKCSQAHNGPRPMPIVELCIFSSKGSKWTFNHVGLANCIHIMRETPNPHQYHRATRPTALYEILVKAFSNEGDLILDPFLGSGTTIMASRRTGRNCLGFEIDPQYESVIRSKTLMDVPTIENFGEIVECAIEEEIKEKNEIPRTT